MAAALQPTALAVKVRAAIDDRGFAVVERLIPADGLTALAQAFRQHEEGSVPMSSEILYTHAPPPAPAIDGPPRGMRRLMDQWLNPHRRPPPLSTLPAADRLRPFVEAWLGEPAVLFQDVLMDKVDAHSAFPWHQDFPFWPVDAPVGIVVWAAIDPVREASGGLALAAGSHRGGLGPAIDLHTGRAQAESGGAMLDPAGYEVARPELAAGDAIVFHPLLWHSSASNRSRSRRRAWASTWLGASARWSHARAPRHPLCRIIEDGAPVGSLGGGLGLGEDEARMKRG